MKNYRLQIGTIKIAAFWHEPKDGKQNGYYSLAITRSERDRDGNWHDTTIYANPTELASLICGLKQFLPIVCPPSAFEIQRTAQPTQSTSTDVGDEIPF